jgi:hypothetical protein
MDLSLTSIPEEHHHTLSPMTISKLLKLMLKLQPLLKRNMSQTGDGTQETHITMDHSQTSTPEELHHTPSPTTTSKSPKPTSKLQHSPNTNQTGDGTQEAPTTTDLSPTSTPEELLHTLSPRMTEKFNQKEKSIWFCTIYI